jgi:hypothetical protein
MTVTRQIVTVSRFIAGVFFGRTSCGGDGAMPGLSFGEGQAQNTGYSIDSSAKAYQN